VVDEALTKTNTGVTLPARQLGSTLLPRGLVEHAKLLGKHKQVAYDFDHVLHVLELDDGWRTVVVERDACGFDRCCEQLVEVDAAIVQAENQLRRGDCPRRTLGVWKSGPRFGQLKIPTKLAPAECLELVAQQDRYDAAAREVETLKATRRHLRMMLGADEPMPRRLLALGPAKTPGKTAAVEMLAFLQAMQTKLGGHADLMLARCVAQLETNLREYESVERFGFAPGSKCIVVADPRDDDKTDRLATVADVVVAERRRTWGEEIWWHERNVVDAKTGEETVVTVERLKAAS
jgi:hypothetical protein